MIEIRPATPGDADALCDVHMESWRVGYRGIFSDELLDSPAFESHRRDIWRRELWRNDIGSEMFAAVVDGRVLGFGHAGPERVTTGSQASGRGEVYGFYLHPDAWGTGIAAPLMRRCETKLRDDGFTCAVLTVLRDNPRAHRFYERAGWSWTGETALWPGPSFPGGPRCEPVEDVIFGRDLTEA